MSQRAFLAISAAVLAAIAIGWGAYELLDGNADGGQATLDIQLGKARLAIPAAYVRNPEYRRSGEFAEMELAASAKDFRPVARPAKLRPGMEDASADIVYLTVREQEKSFDPAERPARLYVRFLDQESWSHPGGLVMRRFEAGSPFAKEDLYMAPPEGRVFAARCMRPQQPPDGLPNTCISEIRMSGLDIRLRFSPNLLADWEHILAGARGLVQSIAR